MQLHQLVYVSTPADGVGIEEVNRILATTAPHNEAAGITGCLAFRFDAFVQALEGDRRTISELFVRICRDRRHHDIELIGCEPVNERRFGTWSMGYACMAEDSFKALPRYADGSPVAPRDMGFGELVSWLEGFATVLTD